MEDALREIIDAVRAGTPVDAVWLDKLVRRHNRAAHDGTRRVAKRRLLPYYLAVRANDPERWAAWNVDEATDRAVVRLLQAKPRRTASGVATITVITKPWRCSSQCIYCPNDIRMPKSYLADEPACQRAERCWFDPFLQVAARLRALTDMGHVTDKVELIVLGGTWSDYSPAYQRWFIGELFRALNANDDERAREAEKRRAFYETLALPRERDDLAAAVASVQKRIDTGELTYNQAWPLVYESDAHRAVADAIEGRDGSASRPGAAPDAQASPLEGAPHPATALDAEALALGSARPVAAPSVPNAPSREGAPTPISPADVERLHRANETAGKRVVGLVVETRPDLITVESCQEMRALGCTKVQLGIQSLDNQRLATNGRAIDDERIAEALALLRLFGFKSHVHFMANLLGATPEADVADYRRLVTDPAFLPDEVKLYPCALVASAQLTKAYEAGTWRPYNEEELVAVLAADVEATPPYTRISRMIRDISATDILVGNKKTNLRQIVEGHLEAENASVQEIRHREIAVDGADAASLTLETVPYRTTVSEERFLQWVTPEGRIAGFLRLSLPTTTIPTLGDTSNGEGATGILSQVAPPVAASDQVTPSVTTGNAKRSPATTLPAQPGEAMIREVHIYGKVAALHQTSEGTQHLGLGRALVEEACRQAAHAGYDALNVISAVGTRDYYRNLGFADHGLYQQRGLQ